MEHGQYVIRGAAEGRERLRMLARVMRPATLTLLERIGIAKGAVCLDVGCGGGDVTLELAAMVGPSGRVVGTDIDEAVLSLAKQEAEQQLTGNVEFRLVGVSELLSEATFDVVYVRFLLTHLSNPARALKQMHAALRPGGVLIAEDIDSTGHFCYPDHAAVRRYIELYVAVVRKRGGDADIGLRLPGLLLDTAFERVQMHLVQPAGLEGEVKILNPMTMESIADAVLSEKLASRNEINELVVELYDLARDPRMLMSGPRVVQSWGYRSSLP